MRTLSELKLFSGNVDIVGERSHAGLESVGRDVPVVVGVVYLLDFFLQNADSFRAFTGK